MNKDALESLLRGAPRPAAPRQLKQRLATDIPFATPSEEAASARNPRAWLHRWFPALSFGMLWLTCLIALAAGTSSFLSLRREHNRLRSASFELEQLRRDKATLMMDQRAIDQARKALADYRELLDLREEAARWRALDQDFQRLQTENGQLKASLALAQETFQSARGPDPFAEALAKAHSTKCVSHLKQICLAARIWSSHLEDPRYPMDFLTMAAELNTPQLLVCPADAKLMPSASWSDFNPASVTYRMLSPGAPLYDPDIVYVRCPIHGHIARADGSVYQAGLEAKFTTENGMTRRLLTPQ